MGGFGGFGGGIVQSSSKTDTLYGTSRGGGGHVGGDGIGQGGTNYGISGTTYVGLIGTNEGYITIEFVS